MQNKSVFTYPLKHIISGDEYYLFGPNKSIINWINSSEAYLAFFESRNISLDELVKALEKSNQSRMNEYSSIVMEKLWSYYPGLGPYPFINILNEFQYDRVFYEKYRDHVCHLLKVFLLGLYIFDKCETIKTSILSEIEKQTGEKSDIKEFHLRWTIAALYHDIGYIFENSGAKSAKGESWKKVKRHIEKVYRTPLSNTRAFEVSVDYEARMIRDEREIAAPRTSWLAAPYDLRWHYKKDLIEDLKIYGLKSNLGFPDDRSSNAVLSYFDFCLKFESTSRTGFIDHGIFGALLLLKTWHIFNEYVTSIKKKIDANETPSAVKDCIPYIQKAMDINNETLLAAAGAICLHNISDIDKNQGDAVSCSLTFDKYCIMLRGENALPLSFLLALCDSLQEWDRPSYSCPKRGKLEGDITDQHMTLLVTDNSICVNYKNHDNFTKTKNNLLGYLENDVIQKLLLNESSGESLRQYNPEKAQLDEIMMTKSRKKAEKAVKKEGFSAYECTLVNRTKETMFIYNLVNGDYFNEDKQSKPKIIQITGKPGTGKTKLLHWVLNKFNKDVEETGVIPVYIDLKRHAFHSNEIYILPEIIFNSISSHISSDKISSEKLIEAIGRCKNENLASEVTKKEIKKSELEAHLTENLLEWLYFILNNQKICLLLDNTDESYLYIMKYLIIDRIIKPIFENRGRTKNNITVVSSGREAYDWGELNDHVISLDPLECFISKDIEDLIKTHIGQTCFGDYRDLVDITWQLTLGFPATSCCFILKLLPSLKSYTSKNIYSIYPKALEQSVEEVIKKRVLSSIKRRYDSPDPYEVLKNLSILREFDFRNFNFIIDRLVYDSKEKLGVPRNKEYMDCFKNDTFFISEQNETYKVDKVIRHFIREHFRVNEKEWYLQTHKEYANMYYKWIKEKEGPALYILDYIYHVSSYLVENSREKFYEPLDKNSIQSNNLELNNKLKKLCEIRFSVENINLHPNDYADLSKLIKTIHTDSDLLNLKDYIDLDSIKSILEQHDRIIKTDAIKF